MQIYYVNGSFEHKSDALISVEDRGFNFSDGVYEVIGFKNKKLLNFNKHVDRLKRSLFNLQIKSPYKNFKSLELIITRLIEINMFLVVLFICKLLEEMQKEIICFLLMLTQMLLYLLFPRKIYQVFQKELKLVYQRI